MCLICSPTKETHSVLSTTKVFYSNTVKILTCLYVTKMYLSSRIRLQVLEYRAQIRKTLTTVQTLNFHLVSGQLTFNLEKIFFFYLGSKHFSNVFIHKKKTIMKFRDKIDTRIPLPCDINLQFIMRLH